MQDFSRFKVKFKSFSRRSFNEENVNKYRFDGNMGQSVNVGGKIWDNIYSNFHFL